MAAWAVLVQHATARGATAIEHVVVVMEKAMAVMREAETSGRVMLVFHFEGFGWMDCDPRLALAFVTLIGQQYPERLHRLVLVDAPFLFEPIWAVVRSACRSPLVGCARQGGGRPDVAGGYAA